MYSSHTMCVNSCATTFMIIFECQDFVRDVAHLRIIIFCKLYFFTPLVLVILARFQMVVHNCLLDCVCF